jgi:hypothetical protein
VNSSREDAMEDGRSLQENNIHAQCRKRVSWKKMQDLCDWHSVKATRQSRLKSCVDAVLFCAVEGHDGLHPHGADNMPAFVPLLPALNVAVSCLAKFTNTAKFDNNHVP